MSRTVKFQPGLVIGDQLPEEFSLIFPFSRLSATVFFFPFLLFFPFLKEENQ